MKTLIVIANPAKASFTHALAESYKKSCQEVEIIDLYDLDQAFLAYETMEDMKAGKYNGGEKQALVHEKISWADELVFFFPVWWGGMPAILKNFFDVNFSSGFAFEFMPGKSMPKQLLVGKTATVFCHCDAPSFLYKIPFFMGINLKKALAKSILGFCGVKMKHFQIIGSLRSLTDEKRKHILETLAQ